MERIYHSQTYKFGRETNTQEVVSTEYIKYGGQNSLSIPDMKGAGLLRTKGFQNDINDDLKMNYTIYI
jgi:hypothetical protein